jgi:2-polyprenyl-3-methyl-5-hydroxy-6-metoxy-1,4-benzoquinol methylase
MTPYEWARLGAAPLLPVLHNRVRRELRRLAESTPKRPLEILDVGGRRSPYTIGLDARVTILDLPRKSEVQHQLELGLNERLLEQIQARRSNVVRVLLEDMTRCSLPTDAFDAVVSVEVIEHVPDDGAFMAQVARVLKPGGWCYFTTPNGDYVKNEPPNYNPDHLRHYKRRELEELLERHFESVRVVYGVRTGVHRARGLRSVSPRRPVSAAVTAFSNVLSHVESRDVEQESRRTAHLLASARKARAAG